MRYGKRLADDDQNRDDRHDTDAVSSNADGATLADDGM